jgi:hypothetical protein
MRTLILLLAAALAVLNLSVFLDTVPGLQGDEAWSGLQRHEIAHGLRPMSGLTPYTGRCSSICSRPVPAARLSRLGAALADRGGDARDAGAGHAPRVATLGADAAVAAALLTATLPAFTAFGRFATENFALNPLLAALAAFLVRRAALTTGARGALMAAGGSGSVSGSGSRITSCSHPRWRRWRPGCSQAGCASCATGACRSAPPRSCSRSFRCC